MGCNWLGMRMDISVCIVVARDKYPNAGDGDTICCVALDMMFSLSDPVNVITSRIHN